MHWENKPPATWAQDVVRHNQKAFCATTDCGEYIIETGNNGKFAVSLDGTLLTAFEYPEATDAMERAEELDIELQQKMRPAD